MCFFWFIGKALGNVVAVFSFTTSRGGAEVARRGHIPKVGGSNPSPATNNHKESMIYERTKN